METFKLPVSNFEWVDEKRVKSWTAKDILKLPTQSDVGYAFECDLIYPKKYHRVSKFIGNQPSTINKSIVECLYNFSER